MRIRDAVSADVAGMSALGTRTFTDAYAYSSDPDDLKSHVQTYFSEASIAEELAKPAVRYFVAQNDGRLAGLIKLRESEPPDLVPTESALEVQQLYVDTSLQRGGVGHQLMARACDEARSRQVGGIWLSVWTDADWAVAFYQKFGFEALGELDFYLGKTHYVDYLMWLPVSAEP